MARFVVSVPPLREVLAILLAVLLLMAAGQPARAQVTSSFTVSDPTLLNQMSLSNSNLAHAPGGPGSHVYNYLAVTLYPAVTGSYTFGQSASSVDTVMIVYRGTFDPLHPHTNVIAFNDDGGNSAFTCGRPNYCPSVTATLTAGQPVVLVISTYSPGSGLTVPQSFTSQGAGSVSFSAVGAALTVPDAPTINSIAPGNGQLVATFGAPSDNGGAIITSYEYRLNGGAWTAFIPNIDTSPGTITGLTNGTSYSVELRAINSEGAGPASNAVAATPRTTPGAPTGLVATPGDGQVGVVFTAPTDTGGAAVTNYEYSTNGGATWVALSPAATASPVTITGLTNGITYTIALRAVNAAGGGTASSTVTATPLTTPSAPANLIATAGDAEVSVAFTAPTNNGGTPITNYEYSTDGGATWTAFSPATTAGPVTITGLSNGTNYNIALRAVNAAGSGAASSSVPATPITTPDAPRITGATPGDGEVSVAFTFASFSGGATVTNLEYSINGGATWTAFSPAVTNDASPVTIAGLTNGTTYSIALREDNLAGSGTPSNTVSVTPRTTPGAPTGLVVTPGDTQVSIAFSAPASDGGSPITNYEYSTDGGSTWTAFSPVTTAGPVTITGLTNGTSYDIALRASNIAGSGTASSTVAATPRTTPGAPSGLVATAGDAEVSVAFTAPTSDGGAPISNFEYSTDGGATWTAFSPATTAGPVTITGLSNGTTYNIALRAVNAAGSGAASSSVPATPITTPDAPRITGATPGDGEVSVAFTFASFSGGATVTNLEYSINGGATWTAFSPAVTNDASPVTIAGLTNGTTYSIALREDNLAGSGTPSNTVSVTPRTTPGAPTGLVATAGDAEVSVAFTAPASDGGAPISNFEYSTDGGATWTAFSPATTAGPVTITGLSNGTNYNIALRAVNVAGSGAASSSVPATPITTPDAPRITGATPGDGEVSVAFTFASFSGGATVTNVEYSINGGATWTAFSPAVTNDASPVTITGLTNGTTYSIALREDNGAGSGTPSNTASVTPRTTASAPTGLVVTPGDTQVSIAFSAPASDGGSPITNYEYSTDGGSTWTAFSAATTASPVTITGLINGTTYDFALRALNAAGAGAPSSNAASVPQTTPDAPTIESVTRIGGSLSVLVRARFDGGSPITDYQYEMNGSGTWVSAGSTGPTIVIPGLVAGTAYTVRFRAVNVVGPGLASAAATAPSASTAFDTYRAEIAQVLSNELLRNLRNDMRTDQAMLRAARERFSEQRAQIRRCTALGSAADTDPACLDEGYNDAIPFETDATVSGTSIGISSQGSFFGATAAAAGQTRRYVFGDFSVTTDETGSVNAQISGRLAWERVFADRTLLGLHLGLNVNNSQIEGTFTGEARSFGITTGPYFVHEMNEQLFLSGYATLGQRWIDLNIANNVLGLTANHESTTASLGLEMTGVYSYGDVQLRPGVSLAYGYSETGPIDFEATAFGITETIAFAGVDASVFEVSVAPEYRFLLDPMGDTTRYFYATPRLTCGRIDSTITTNDCGGGLTLGLSENWNRGRTQLSFIAEYLEIGGLQTSGLNLSLEHRF